MWKCPKYLINLHESALIMFFHQFGGSWFGKYLPWCYVKSKGCLLTHWLAMASILFNIARICNSQFKCKFLKNEKLFFDLLFHFWNLPQILNILKKKMMVLANVLRKLQTVKNFITPLCKKLRFGTRLVSRHVKVSGIFTKSPWECFYHVFSSISGTLIWKICPLVLGEI